MLCFRLSAMEAYVIFMDNDMGQSLCTRLRQGV